MGTHSKGEKDHVSKVLSLEQIAAAAFARMHGSTMIGYNDMGVRTDVWTKEYCQQLLYTTREYHRLREALRFIAFAEDQERLDAGFPFDYQVAREALKESEGG